MSLRATLGLLSALVVLLPGCYSDEADYIVTRAKLDCIRIAECDGSRFANQYDNNMDECRGDLEDWHELLGDGADFIGQEYSPDGGRECISVARANKRACGSGPSDDIVDACDRVYD
ncbi:MAG: hypothetical protein R3A79_02215 [Nannocystaceae bacterium]